MKVPSALHNIGSNGTALLRGTSLQPGFATSGGFVRLIHQEEGL